MSPQTFSAADLPVIGFLVLLEGLLSADNALVLAIMVRHLPRVEQKKALLYGLGGAFVFRALAILLASYIIQLWWLQLIGAGYLLYITIKHFRQRHVGDDAVGSAVQKGFWATVVAVELTDIAFAVDSVVAAVAIVKGPEKLWVVYTGAIFGVVLLRFAAGFFIGLLDKFPSLEHLAYALVGWVGVKLSLMAGHNAIVAYNRSAPERLGFAIPEMPHLVFWGVMGLMIAVGIIHAVRNRAPRGEASLATSQPIFVEGRTEHNSSSEET
ncbi:MAG: hypothetical protein KIT11_00180 [Fimbriimonadaceae bacterium]|nr:hypothetical protein [Fimbriimonadaceae bacterium]QYK55209.1 MAG: hypothetical protein KF733_09355 [Fimbriimonadaceae bacterium]